jgi:hypothetical protein
MGAMERLLFGGALVVVWLTNLAAALMPFSWMVIAFFYIHYDLIQYDLLFIPLAIAVALLSGLLRAVLARASELVTEPSLKEG